MYNSLPFFFISSKVVNMFNTGMCAPLREICSSNVTKKIILNLSRSHVRYGRHFPFFIMMFCDCFYCLILCSLAFFCLIRRLLFLLFSRDDNVSPLCDNFIIFLHWRWYLFLVLRLILFLEPLIYQICLNALYKNQLHLPGNLNVDARQI